MKDEYKSTFEGLFTSVYYYFYAEIQLIYAINIII